MNAHIVSIEKQRLELQHKLDSAKTNAQRNVQGQFATPSDLARDVVAHALDHMRTSPIRFLDPAVGTGSFLSALFLERGRRKVELARGFEIDPHYGLPSSELWSSRADISYQLADFTKQTPDAVYNLIVCNPPYVRHHHIKSAEKSRLQAAARMMSGMNLSGLSGLYCYFLGLVHPWMAPGAVAAWLIPSEFMTVKYGSEIRRYLCDDVTLLQIHRFDPSESQFADALVTSAVVLFQNNKPSPSRAQRTAIFSFGGSLADPAVSKDIAVERLREDQKWLRYPLATVATPKHAVSLGDYFTIKRGLATGANEFFILSEEEVRELAIPRGQLRAILPSPRHLTTNEVNSDKDGNPTLDRKLFLIDCKLQPGEVQKKHPALWTYFKSGEDRNFDKGYICRNRSPWWRQEARDAPPIVCTYIGRGSRVRVQPFRFIRNRSNAIIANVYLGLYPKPAVRRLGIHQDKVFDIVWKQLNELSVEELTEQGRVYGGGMHKLEPKELAGVPLHGSVFETGVARMAEAKISLYDDAEVS